MKKEKPQDFANDPWWEPSAYVPKLTEQEFKMLYQNETYYSANPEEAYNDQIVTHRVDGDSTGHIKLDRGIISEDYPILELFYAPDENFPKFLKFRLVVSEGDVLRNVNIDAILEVLSTRYRYTDQLREQAFHAWMKHAIVSRGFHQHTPLEVWYHA